MLNLRNIAGLAAGALLATTVSASAAVVFTVLDSSTENGANTADVYAGGYSAALPNGASWTSSPTLRTGDLSDVYKSPFHDTDLQDVNSYWAVGPTNPTNPAVLKFAPGTTSLTMLWGSIDTYNDVTFTI